MKLFFYIYLLFAIYGIKAEGISCQEHLKNNKEYYDGILQKYPPLSREDELKAVEKFINGDLEARNLLILSNMRFAYLLAKRFEKLNIPLEDLLQAANLGLILAIRKFDTEKQVRFASYAQYWIWFSLQNAVRRHRLIHIPPKIDQYVRLRRKIQAIHGREPNEKERKKIGLRKKSFEKIDWNALPLYNRGYSDRGLQDSSAPVSPSKLLKKQEEDLDKLIFETLDEREQKIIQLYFGFKGEPLSLREVGIEIGMTGENVRILKAAALKKLANKLLK